MTEDEKNIFLCPYCYAEIIQEHSIAICTICSRIYHADCTATFNFDCVVLGCGGKLIVQPEKTTMKVLGTKAEDVIQVSGSLKTKFSSYFLAKQEIKKIKILFLASNPIDTSRLRLDKEAREISERIKKTDLRDLFELKQEWAVRVSDLQGHLLHHKPTIVHFSGHGSKSDEIILEDDFGNSHILSDRALSRLFSMFKDDVKCVILNACFSEKQARAIAEHIDYVIGMSKAITDGSAISFASAFYQALGYGKDIKSAFDLGCIQLDLDNLEEQDTPKLININEVPKDKSSVSGIEFVNIVHNAENPISLDGINNKQKVITVCVVTNTYRSFIKLSIDSVVGIAINRLVEIFGLPTKLDDETTIQYKLFSKVKNKDLDSDKTFRQNLVEELEVLEFLTSGRIEQ